MSLREASLRGYFQVSYQRRFRTEAQLYRLLFDPKLKYYNIPGICVRDILIIDCDSNLLLYLFNCFCEGSWIVHANMYSRCALSERAINKSHRISEACECHIWSIHTSRLVLFHRIGVLSKFHPHGHVVVSRVPSFPDPAVVVSIDQMIVSEK